MIYEAALLIAAKAHHGQFRTNGDPYVTHPIRVAARVKMRANFDDLGPITIEHLQAVSILHDVLEDTDVPAIDIERVVGSAVARDVEILTRPPKQFRTLTYVQYIDQILGTNKDVVIRVKIADLEDNMALPLAGWPQSMLGEAPPDSLLNRYVKAHERLMGALQ